MNTLSTIKRTMSSREIAQLTGKMHNDVLKAIRAMEPAWQKVTGGNFPLSTYIDSTGRTLPQYQLSKKECLYIATKFNDVARAKLVIRWEELETLYHLPQSFSEALMLAAQQAEKLEQKERQLQKQAPKVLFADAVTASKTSILIGEMAKILRQNGIEIGQNRLFEWLRNKGYLISRYGTDYNTPTQRAMELGLFSIKETTISHADGHISISKTTKVTGKGQTYFINKFLSRQAITAS